MCAVEVIWYGERGVVNSIVDGLKRGGLEIIQTFLGSVLWANGDQKDWIKDVKSVQLIVEVGLGQFGDPDLIIVCNTGENVPHVIFLEAKITPYAASAELDSSSKINRQLTLKYRFVQSLSQWNRDGKVIKESETAFRSYSRPQESSNLEERHYQPRYLAKATVLGICRRAGLALIPMERCYFVAMTWDREPFFKSTNFESSSIRPVFLDADGNEYLKSIGNRLGWIGYITIDQSVELKNAFGQQYERALKTMVPTVAPEQVDITNMSSLPYYRSHNLQSFSKVTLNQLDALEEVLRVHFGMETVTRLKGSTSVTLCYAPLNKKKVMLKLMPQGPGADEHILLGISVEFQRTQIDDIRLEGPVAIGSADNKQPFLIVRLPNTPDGIEKARIVCEELAQTVDRKDEEQN